MDTSKLKTSVAVVEGKRNGEVQFLGDISSERASVATIVKKLARRGARFTFAMRLDHVVAPSLVPKRLGDRVKTIRRDAISLARLH